MQALGNISGPLIALLYPFSQAFPIGSFWAARLIAQLAGEQATRVPEAPAAPPLLLSGLPLEATYPTLIKIFPTRALHQPLSANFRRLALDLYRSKREEAAVQNWIKKSKTVMGVKYQKYSVLELQDYLSGLQALALKDNLLP